MTLKYYISQRGVLFLGDENGKWPYVISTKTKQEPDDCFKEKATMDITFTAFIDIVNKPHLTVDGGRLVWEGQEMPVRLKSVHNVETPFVRASGIFEYGGTIQFP